MQRLGLTLSYSNGKPESMVSIGRPSLHHRGFCHGTAHDTRPRIPILRSRSAQIRAEYDLGVYGLVLGHHFPMVFLGLLACLLEHRDAVHWRSAALWSHEHVGHAESGLAADSGTAVQLLPGMCVPPPLRR